MLKGIANGEKVDIPPTTALRDRIRAAGVTAAMALDNEGHVLWAVPPVDSGDGAPGDHSTELGNVAGAEQGDAPSAGVAKKEKGEGGKRGSGIADHRI